jgi:hypothetical protein
VCVCVRAVASVQPLKRKADWLIFKWLLFVFSPGPVCAWALTIKEPGLFWRWRTPGKTKRGWRGLAVGREGNVALVFYISTEWLPSNKDALHSVAVWNKPLVSCSEEALAQTMGPGQDSAVMSAGSGTVESDVYAHSDIYMIKRNCLYWANKMWWDNGACERVIVY